MVLEHCKYCLHRKTPPHLLQRLLPTVAWLFFCVIAAVTSSRPQLAVILGCNCLGSSHML